jgi:hypothetical protein
VRLYQWVSLRVFLFFKKKGQGRTLARAMAGRAKRKAAVNFIVCVRSIYKVYIMWCCRDCGR